LGASIYQLKGAIDYTIANVCAIEDQKASMGLDNYAQECDKLITSLKMMQRSVSKYVCLVLY